MLPGPRVDVSMGSALCVSCSIPSSPEPAPDPKGWAVAPPTSQIKRGELEAGTKSPHASWTASGRKHGLRPVCELFNPEFPRAGSRPEGLGRGPSNIPDKEGGAGSGDEVPPCFLDREWT